MAFPYTIDSNQKIARITLSGSVRGAAIADTIEAVYRDPQWQHGFDTLWDGTKITELLLERDDQRGFVRLQQHYADVAGPGRDVLLVTRPLDRMMSSIYATLARSGPRETHVCDSEAEAWRILGKGKNGD